MKAKLYWGYHVYLGWWNQGPVRTNAFSFENTNISMRCVHTKTIRKPMHLKRFPKWKHLKTHRFEYASLSVQTVACEQVPQWRKSAKINQRAKQTARRLGKISPGPLFSSLIPDQRACSQAMWMAAFENADVIHIT